MWKLINLCLILVCNLAMFVQFTFAANEKLSFAVPESLDIKVDYTAYCLFETTINNMGYQLNHVKLPLMRTLTETQRGNIALILIAKLNFKTDVKSKTIPQGIALAATPYLITAISFYSQKHSNIMMDKADWQASYRFGVVRSTFTHDTKKLDANRESNNYYFYVNSLSAFKALLRQRVDIVVTSELEYLSAQAILTFDDKIKNIVSLGTTSLYPGFSHLYFGEENAKALAKRYDTESAQLADLSRKQCAR